MSPLWMMGKLEGLSNRKAAGRFADSSLFCPPSAPHVPPLIDDSGLTSSVFAQFIHLTATQKANENELFGPFAGF